MQPSSPFIAHGSSSLAGLHSESNLERKSTRWILLKGLVGHERSTAAWSESILWKVILSCGLDPSHFSITGRVAEARKEWEADQAVLMINEECKEQNSALRAVSIDFKRYCSYLFDYQRSERVHWCTNHIEKRSLHIIPAVPYFLPDQSGLIDLSINYAGQYLLQSHLLSPPLALSRILRPLVYTTDLFFSTSDVETYLSVSNQRVLVHARTSDMKN